MNDKIKLISLICYGLSEVSNDDLNKILVVLEKFLKIYEYGFDKRKNYKYDCFNNEEIILLLLLLKGQSYSIYTDDGKLIRFLDFNSMSKNSITNHFVNTYISKKYELECVKISQLKYRINFNIIYNIDGISIRKHIQLYEDDMFLSDLKEIILMLRMKIFIELGG